MPKNLCWEIVTINLSANSYEQKIGYKGEVEKLSIKLLLKKLYQKIMIRNCGDNFCSPKCYTQKL
jgi:hypothetical protein